MVKSAEQIHFILLRGVFHLPMSFYDTNPIGRVLQLFSSDFHVVEEELPESVGVTIWLVLEVTLSHQFMCCCVDVRAQLTLDFYNTYFSSFNLSIQELST